MEDPKDLTSIRICDFGLSKKFKTNELQTLWKKNGTAWYMAPEINGQ